MRLLLTVMLLSVAMADSSGSSVAQTPASGSGTVGPHAYFDRLSARPERLHAFGLRSQAEIDAVDASSASNERVRYVWPHDTYNLKQDAAKIILPGWGRLSRVNGASTTPIADKLSTAYQLFLPINVRSGRMLITWDAWYGPEWNRPTSRSAGHKAFQIEVFRPDYRRSTLWFEPNFELLNSDTEITVVKARPYYAAGGRAVPPMRSERMTPIEEFRIATATWTRFWVDIDLEVNPGYATLSMWAADENRDAVQIYDAIQFRQDPRLPSDGGNDIAKGISRFRVEYDTSADFRGRPEKHDSLPDMIGYVRNYVVLANLRNPAPLFERPIGDLTQSTTLSAPRRLRIVQ